MVDAILHIGFGKTGTSSIQQYLCRYDLPGTNLVYCVLNKSGELSTGDALREAARRKITGYVVSTPSMVSGDPVAAIRAIRDRGRMPLLSQEDWARSAEPLKYLHGLDLKVIAYVRPQVEWFNAGWWQWWRWEDGITSPDDVLDQWGTEFLRWAAQLSVWRQSPLVSDLTVRLYAGDVVADFLSHLGVSHIEPTVRTNQSLSRALLKLYEAAPSIRKQNPSEMDALLASVIDDESKAPWAVNAGLAKRMGIIPLTYVRIFRTKGYVQEQIAPVFGS